MSERETCSETMAGQRLLFVNLMILFIGHSAGQCDRSTTAQVREGTLGQSSDFNWLGVLSVHLHDGDKFHIGMTGIVLIKHNQALASADDVWRIPASMFQSESKAIFIAARNTPWVVRPVSYVTHPEYEYSTLNSIAIIELDTDHVNDHPLNPVCFPTGETFNTAGYLYLTGFTDENEILEKVIYKIQYLDKKVCEEFYNKAGLSFEKRTPTAYLCGYAPGNVTQCVWDNGMTLVSNATGYFTLIGFGVRGPGCAAPARFIDLFPYFPWIYSNINPDELEYRRMANDELVPIHELFSNNGSRRQTSEVTRHNFVRYPFDKNSIKHHITKPTEDNKAKFIYPSNSSRNNISQQNMRTVQERVQIAQGVNVSRILQAGSRRDGGSHHE